MENDMEISLKKKKKKLGMNLACEPAISLLDMRTPQSWETHVPNLHCNTIYNSQDMEAT